jgi:heat shock protein HtpX
MSTNTIQTYTVLAALGGFLILVGGAAGGSGGLMIGLLLGLALVGGSYWFSDRIAVKAARAVPVTEAEAPALYRIVRDLTTRADMPMPKLYVTPSLQPNAFATGRNPEHASVACTQGILQMRPEDELKGVLAHELSHVGNRDILIGSVAAAIAMAITFIARMAMFGAILGGGGRKPSNPLGELAFALLAPGPCCCRWRCPGPGNSRPTATGRSCWGRASPWPGPWRRSRPAPSGSRWTSTPPRPRPTS